MNLLPATLPFVVQLLIFVASAVVTWVAGIWLSNYTDILADRLHLGQALGGLILLAVATNLPEIATTYSAAASGQLDVAVSNILTFGVSRATIYRALDTAALADIVPTSGSPADGKPLPHRNGPTSSPARAQ